MDSLQTVRREAEQKAWDSLGKYKFYMFGYHASRWVLLNKLLPGGLKQRNPFRDLVLTARTKNPTACKGENGRF